MYADAAPLDAVTDDSLVYHLRGEFGTDLLAVVVSTDAPRPERPGLVAAVCDSPWTQRRLTGAGTSQIDIFVIAYKALFDRSSELERYSNALA
jgi:hypothetical protein